MSDEIKFTCEECGKQFDPDPDTMLELHLGPEPCPCCEGGEAHQEELEKAVEDGEAFTADQLAAMSEDHLKEIGLTPEDRDKLLRGETITTGAICICKECQDRLAGEE